MRNDGGDNLIPINISSKSELKAALESLKRDIEVMEEYTILVARVRWASYKAHIEQGFSEEEALELCKSLEI